MCGASCAVAAMTLRVEGAELVGEVAVEADAGLAAVAGVDLGRGRAVATGLEELPVGGGHAAAAPETRHG